MLEKIQFINYKCFENATVPLKDLTIAVGKNNAGKSTLIEGLRLVALAIKIGEKQNYKDLPGVFNERNKKSKKLNIDLLKIDLRTVSHFYKQDLISKIIAYFERGNRVEIFISESIAYACYFDKSNRNIKNSKKFIESGFPKIEILPQIGLIKEAEKRLADSTISNGRDTYLSSRHFRNEILAEKERDESVYEKFRNLAESRWPGLKIVALDFPTIGFNTEDTPPIQLLIEADRFTSEIGYMGSGLQMWLQIIWFVCKAEGSDTVILDEPDVYMHPDLQRSLLKIVRKRFKQVIIASHSVEILSEVNPDNVVLIDKTRRNMKFSSDMLSVQYALEDLGSSQNITLLRIANSKKCIFLENSSDLKKLNKVYERFFSETSDSLLTLPFVELKGASNLPQAFGLSKLLHNETSGTIKVLCILDRDYFPETDLKEKLEAACEAHLELRFWNKKEIENYFLIPKVFFKISGESDEDEFLALFDEKIDEFFKDAVTDSIATQLQQLNRGWQAAKANKEARKIRNKSWNSLDEKLSIIGGKECLKMVREWFQRDYNITFSEDDILKHADLEDFDNEIIETIKWLKNN
ncbi:ATP-binding protein [Streptococcus suis]|nr:ATP-binding protein [Streptococcus suis]NQO91477.1 ATP-binding protein [Streptococcus suis]HEM5462069.1 ATP-binding protein [Streptococcus suis]HEM5470510.1 ATP-binding protein [Streptococcus suis]